MDGVTGWNRFRNYEMSVWTLQDSYITTLKSGDPIIIDNNIGKSAMVWPQARAQGQIQNGQMEIDVDGTQNLSFDIPMYIYINGKKVENPNWYNAVTKNVLVSMRKIKVIFNKWQLTTREERSASTFEFIILKVQETHEQDNLICHVECEGLAFHELGKIGYKYALSAEEFYNQNYEWNKKKDAQGSQEHDVSNEELGEEPIATIDYWMTNERNGLNMQWIPKTEEGNITDETVAKMDPTVWYFDVRMSHSSLLHEENVTSTQIYEEGYPSDWDDNGDTPTAHEATKEMARLVDLKESNIYNITQDLAEKFQVFCRYEYIYNNNYNIIGRVIVFYNNFLQEGKDVQTLMYPNSATKIMREMDSTDISTKMFVRSVDAEDLYLGEVNIMDCTANMSREDYLLNFDYLHDIGTISKEQYEEVSKFLKKMRTCNSKIVPLQEAWSALSNFKPEIDAKVTNYKESIELDQERITQNAAYMNAIDAADGDADGYITRDYRNPLVLSLLKDSENTKYDTYYVQLNQNDENRGIKPDTLKLYKENHTTATIYYRYGISFTPWSTSNFLVSEKTNTVNIFSTPSNITTDIDYRLTYKGNIDNSEDVLPAAEDNNKGWYYRITLDNGYLNHKKGDLILSDGKKWHYIVRPDGQDGTPYESGYFLYTKTITIAVNGPTTEVCTCKREGAAKVDGGKDYTTENYITQIRHLYYTTMGDAPKKPVVETKFTSATEIVNSTTVNDKWSSEIGVPDNFTNHSSEYKLFGSWEFSYKSKIGGNAANKDNKIKYSGVTTVAYTASKPSEDSYEEVKWRDSIRDASGSALTGEVKGKFEYDEYHNLDKVTGIFVRSKIGTYNSYKVISEDRFIGTIGSEYISSRPYATNNNNYSGINSLITSLSSDATANEYPSIDSRKGKYVVIKKTTYHTNGNITYAYDLKYHDNGDINTSPTLSDDDTKNSALLSQLVLNVSPIFYLDTKNSNASAIPLPNSNTQQLSVVSSNVTDKWTTILPDKTKNAQKYYSGWVVTFYDNAKKYYVLTNSDGNAVKEDTSLSKKSSTTTGDTSSVPKYLYATFKYKPNWYYENIKKAWMRKLDNDNANVTKYETKQREIAAMIQYIRYTLLENELNKKNAIIRKFEHMMGAALRESYWQPEDEYQDYGSKFKEQLNFPFTGLINKASTFYKNSANKTKAYSGWDIIRFDNESEAYYEVSTNRDKIYYPMIDLTALGKSQNLASTAANRKTFFECYKEASTASEAESYAFFYNPTNETIPVSASDKDIRYCDFFTIGSRAHFAFVSCPGDSETTCTVKPVLILTDAASLSDDELQNLYKTGYIGKLKTVESDNNILLEQIPEYTFQIYKETKSGQSGWNAWLNASIENGKWVEKDEQEMKNYRAVSPRILIPSLKLKTDSKYLTVKYDGIELEKFKDYYLQVQTYYKSSYLPKSSNENNPDWTDNSVSYIRRKFLSLEKLKKSEWGNTGQYKTYYTITIKPEYILAHYPSGTLQFDVTYHISNADMSIYLDAKKILKENAYPKVAYEIEVSKWSPTLLQNIYTKLAQIVMINDTDLKLQNTFGYISNVKLDLDHEEKDSVEVKNYKTKFEDLFSRIVAETEEMHKNSRNLSLAGALVGGQGGSDVPLSKKGMEDTLSDPSTKSLLQDFLKEYFDGPEVVQKKLKELWDEAGTILGSAATSLDSVMGLTTENASILAGFRENVLASMTPKIFTGDTPPTNFKPGDIWINDNDGYRGVATGYGGSGGFVRTYDGKLCEITGASLNIDAATGTIDILGQTAINLKSGQDIYIAANDTVNIVGNNEVNIGGASINIISSEFVNNDGTYPTPEKPMGVHLIATRYQIDGDDVSETDINSSSQVDIDGNGIVMASRNGIQIKSGAGIDIKSSNDENVSAIQIDKDKGIYIGSSAKLKLYSGTAAEYFYGPYHGAKFHKGDYWEETEVTEGKTNLDDTTKEQLSQDENYYYSNKITVNTHYKATKDWSELYGNEAAAKAAVDSTTGWETISEGPDIKGASVELSPEHLLLGMGDVSKNSATAIDMTTDEIIIAAGKNLSDIKTAKDENDNPILLTEMGDASITGIQIKSNYIGMAIADTVEVNGVNTNVRSIFSMTPKLIQLGQMTLLPSTQNETHDGSKPEDFSGSFLWLAKDEVYIGTLGNFTVNTNNMKIQTKNFVKIGNNDYRAAEETELADVSQMGFCLGKNLQGLGGADPNPALGFWIDKKDKVHLVVDADLVRLGHSGVVDSLSLSETLPTETQILYILHSSKSSYSALKPSSYSWAQLTLTDFTANDANPKWQLGLPSPANREQDGNKYVWSTTQSIYDTVDANGNKIKKYRYSIPRYEGLVDNLTQKTYKQYKYFESELVRADATETAALEAAALAETSGWTIGIPSRGKDTTYYYGTNACTVGTAFTQNTSINDSDNSNYTIRQNTSTSTITITVTDSNNKTRTIDLAKNKWIIKVKGIWIATTNLSKKANSYILYSRNHIIKNDGTTFNKNLQKEDELGDLSAVGIQAFNIASGAQPVPSVSSSGLVIDGDNVVLGSTGKLMLLGNSEVFIGTSSSNSAMVLNKSGIAIGSGADIGVCAGGKIEFYSGTGRNSNASCFVMDPANGINMKSATVTIGASSKIEINDSSNNAITLDKNGITLASNKNLIVNIEGKNSSNVIKRIFKIDTSKLTASNTNPVLQILAGLNDGTDFDHATSAVEFSVNNGLKVKGALTATSLMVGTDGGSSYMKYNSSDGLVIKGDITATAGQIGGWIIDDKMLRGTKVDNNNNAINAYVELNPVYSVTGGKASNVLTINVKKGNKYETPFAITYDGTLVVSNMVYIDDGKPAHTIRSYDTTNRIITLDNGDEINFNSASVTGNVTGVVFRGGYAYVKIDEVQQDTGYALPGGENWKLERKSAGFAKASLTVGGKSYEQTFHYDWIN